jgi:hypothetical protein
MAAVDLVRRAARRFGVDIVRYRTVPPDFAPADAALARSVRRYTMTSPERVFALVNAVRWLVGEKVSGAVVECGVWRGGSMMAVARALLEAGVDDRDLYLFDTYEGMTAPTAHDRDYRGRRAAGKFKRTSLGANSSDWCRATLTEVQANLARTGYPSHRLHYVKGSVEQTVPASAPQQIALLRLDTDWYASTKHELVHLWPRLVPGGVCIIDDYGYWAGSRQAVDEYLDEHGIRVLMHRIDDTGRLIVKH